MLLFSPLLLCRFVPKRAQLAHELLLDTRLILLVDERVHLFEPLISIFVDLLHRGNDSLYLVSHFLTSLVHLGHSQVAEDGALGRVREGKRETDLSVNSVWLDMLILLNDVVPGWSEIADKLLES